VGVANDDNAAAETVLADTLDGDANAADAGSAGAASAVDGAIAVDTPSDQLEYEGVLLPSHTVVELRVSF
jgi:hypothetical protein